MALPSSPPFNCGDANALSALKHLLFKHRLCPISSLPAFSWSAFKHLLFKHRLSPISSLLTTSWSALKHLRSNSRLSPICSLSTFSLSVRKYLRFIYRLSPISSPPTSSFSSQKFSILPFGCDGRSVVSSCPHIRTLTPGICIRTMSVQEYLEKHKLSSRIEDAVNAAVRAKSPDPVIFIADHLKKAVPGVVTKCRARQIIDSRGNPTVEVDVWTGKGMFRAAVPSGASTGIHEAVELRDDDKAVYMGKGVLKAVANVNDKIAPAIMGMDPTQQTKIDRTMMEVDKTENKGNLGANAILAVSMAVCKAGASEKGIPLYQHIADLAGNPKLVLPVPAFNIINGGSHAGNKLAMQEFMILPVGAPTFSEAMRYGAEVYHHLKSVIKGKYGIDACNVGDEGGFAPSISSNKEGLDLVKEAIEKAGYTGKVKIGMDVAASEFFTSDKRYDLDFKTPNNSGAEVKSGDEMIELYKSFCKDYPIISIEDPFEQDDWEHTKKLTDLKICQVVGDDILVTNPKRVAKAIDGNTCNALLLKINQIGTITESIEAVNMSKKAGWGVMASHRSGETEDSFIADLAVGLSTGQIKTGAPCRSERLAKYNQLLRIEEELGDKAVYAGENWRPKL